MYIDFLKAAGTSKRVRAHLSLCVCACVLSVFGLCCCGRLRPGHLRRGLQRQRRGRRVFPSGHRRPCRAREERRRPGRLEALRLAMFRLNLTAPRLHAIAPRCPELPRGSGPAFAAAPRRCQCPNRPLSLPSEL